MTDSTKPDKYTPTKCEIKLLAVLLDPDHRYKNVVEKCTIADINRNTYYNSFDKPDFVAYYHAECHKLVKASVGPVITAFQKAAVAGSFQHGKTLLEMASMHSDSLALTGPNGGPIHTINSDMDPKEAARIYAEQVKGDKKT